PLMRELVHERWAYISWWLINVGLLGALLSALFMWVLPLQIASGLLGVGLALAAVNIAGIVRHLDKRYVFVPHARSPRLSRPYGDEPSPQKPYL
ncbi:MAG: hypothetical protein ACJ8BW_36490, partial [Ktedonobacteraceae bacterium]